MGHHQHGETLTHIHHTEFNSCTLSPLLILLMMHTHHSSSSSLSSASVSRAAAGRALSGALRLKQPVPLSGGCPTTMRDEFDCGVETGMVSLQP